MERAERADSIANGATDDGRADGGAVLRADAAADGGTVRCALALADDTARPVADDSARPVAHNTACPVADAPLADDTACSVAYDTTRSVAHGALADDSAHPVAHDSACPVAHGALADASANPGVDDACTDGASARAGTDSTRTRADRAVARADRSETPFRDDGRLDAGDRDGRRYHRSSLRRTAVLRSPRREHSVWRNCRSARGSALRRRRRLALRTVLYGNGCLRAYCGSYPWADVLPHDGPTFGPADSVALRGTNDGRAVGSADHRGTDDGHANDAGAVSRAHDGPADAAPHARAHARADDASAFARADDGRADARPRGLPS